MTLYLIEGQCYVFSTYLTTRHYLKGLLLHRVKAPIASGLTVGLLGGSFDPPHIGHLHLTKRAFNAVGLNQVWWLVSPRNPLKDEPHADLSERARKCEEIIRHRRIFISDIEVYFKTQFTSDTLVKLHSRYPGVRFVWLMGADNLSTFHRWRNWNWIIENIPIVVMPRPSMQIRAGLSPTAKRYQKYRIKLHQAKSLPFRKAPAWLVLGGSMLDISSSSIRSKGSSR